MNKICILDYKCGNIYSLHNAISKFSNNVLISSNKNEIIRSDIIFLPGVGSFPEAMKNLKKKGMDEFFFKEMIIQNKILVGICLGFQLLFSSSDEFSKTNGLNLIKGKVKSIYDLSKLKRKRTNMGWLKVSNNQNINFFQNLNKEYYYFAHSFCVNKIEEKTDIKICETMFFDVNFVSFIKKNNIFGFQFHPEKSGEAGLNCLKKIIEKKF